MKNLFILIFAASISLTACGQSGSNSVVTSGTIKDTIKEVYTEGIFDATYIAKTGYKINEYYIAFEDMTSAQVDSLKGKRIVVKGKLKIVRGSQNGNIQNTSEDRMYITEPRFKYYMFKEPEGFIAK